MPVEHRLVGVPGSGKTTALTGIVKDLLDSGRYGPHEIVVASFTRTAAFHIAGKLSGVAKEHVGTLHSLCYRAVQQEGVPFRVAEGEYELWNEYLSAHDYPGTWRMTAAATEDDFFAAPMLDIEKNSTGNDVLQQVNIYRAQCVPVEEWHPMAQSFYQAWNNYKFEADLLDFTDLIAYCLDANVPPPAGVKCGVFDEVQDFTILQMRLLRQWNQNTFDEMWLAFDEDQAIYGFVGADPRLLVEDVPDVEVDKTLLTQSWRLPRKIAERAVKQVANVEFRYQKEIVPLREGGAIYRVPTDYTQASGWLPRLKEEYSAGKSVMVLASCGYMLKNILGLLREQGIPFANMYRPTAPQWNPLTSTRGTTAAQRLAAFAKGPQYWQLRDVKEFCEHLVSRKNGGAIQFGQKERIKNARLDRNDSVLAKLSEWMTEEALPYVLTADIAWYLDHVESSRQEQYAYAALVFKKWGLDALTDLPKVTVGTIHSVKGGEADVVFLAPDISRTAYTQAKKETLARDTLARLFYVGLTRAKESVYILQPYARSSAWWDTKEGRIG